MAEMPTKTMYDEALKDSNTHQLLPSIGPIALIIPTPQDLNMFIKKVSNNGDKIVLFICSQQANNIILR